MRIVFIQSGLGAGGAEKIIAILARHRFKAGDEVHVLAMTCPPEGPYFKYPDDIKLHVMEEAAPDRSMAMQFKRMMWIRKRLGKIQPDLVVSFLTKTNVLTLLASTGRKFPVIISERNNPEVQKNNVVWRYLNRWMSRWADGLVMLTHRAKSDLPPTLKRRAVVIHNPCVIPDNVVFAPLDQKRIVAVGRLDRQKGFDLLIEAYDTVRRDHPEATLTIFGEGQARRELEHLVRRKNLADVVSLPGTTRKQAAWIEQGDIFVLSSRHEGFGNVVAEATVAGFPTIAFDCDYGPGELIDHMVNGILVPPGDVAALGRAISSLLSDPDLRRRLTDAAHINRKKFDFGTILAQWDALIEKTMHHQPGGAGLRKSSPVP